MEPIRELLREQSKGLITAYPEIALGLASCKYVEYTHLLSRADSIFSASMMIRFLELLRTNYGGGRGYFKNNCGFTDDELDLLHGELLVDETTDEWLE